MDSVPVLTFVALLAAWNIFLYKRSGGRAWSPLWMAFSTTAAAVLFLVAGTIGYTLSRHDRFVADTAWAGGVIWWEIASSRCRAPRCLLLAQGSSKDPRSLSRQSTGWISLLPQGRR